MKRGAVLAMLLTACSVDTFVDGDAAVPDAATTDASMDVTVSDVVLIDSAVPSCDPTAAFGTPTPVTELNSTSDEFDARLTADELTVFLVSTRGGVSPDIYTATRKLRTSAFSTPTLVTTVSTSANEWGSDPGPDGLTLLFASDRGGPSTLGSDDIFKASRLAQTDSFGTADPLTILNSPYIEATPYLVADGVFLASNRGSGSLVAPLELYFAASTADGYVAPIAITDLDTNDTNSAPVVTHDELTIYFSSDRSGGDTDIWTSQRTSTTAKWKSPSRVAELSQSVAKDAPTWISPDSCRIYFQSDRAGTSDIWMASRVQ